MSDSASKRIFFTGLDELRAVAAFLVVFYHLELFKKHNGNASLYDKWWAKNLISDLGHNGVICFFVLSGFLITYLLLAEKKEFGTIKIKEFYIRRILRIWPLYFLIVVIGFVVMPVLTKLSFFSNETYYKDGVESMSYFTIIWFIFFASNFALALHKPISAASQSWSVSVEEQFYLIWPWLVQKTKSMKGLFYTIVILFFVKTAMNLSVELILGKAFWLTRMLKMFQIEYMCIGAIGAIVFFGNWHQKIKRVLDHRLFVFIMFCTLIFEMATYNHTLVLALVFLFFIYTLIEKQVEVKFLKFLGKISYGIYMFHPLMMFLSYSISLHIVSHVGLKFNLIYYFITILFTVFASHISYKYFESYFLKFKSKYTVIASGAN